MPAHRKPVPPTTVGGVPVAHEPMAAAVATTTPSKVSVYAKAVATFIITALGAIGAWSATIGNGPITRNEWIGLAVALAAPFGAATGVAITTNAKPADPEAGEVSWGLLVVVLLAAIFLAIVFGWHFSSH